MLVQCRAYTLHRDNTRVIALGHLQDQGIAGLQVRVLSRKDLRGTLKQVLAQNIHHLRQYRAVGAQQG